MKLTKARLQKIIKEELEGLGETDVIDDFLSAPVGEESPELTEGQMELWFTLQNAEMIATLAVMAATVGITGLRALGAIALKFLEDRQVNARETARTAREKAKKEQAEAELVLLTDFLLEDSTFVAALEGLVTSGSRKDVIAFNKSVRGKIKELGSMVSADPEELLKRLRKKADAGKIEQRVVSDFEEKVSSVDPEYDAEALRKAEPVSSAPRQRQKIKESIKGTNKMKLTKAKLQKIIKEEINAVREEAEQLELPFKDTRIAQAAKFFSLPTDELKAAVDPDGKATIEDITQRIEDAMVKAHRSMTFDEKYDNPDKDATMGQYVIKILQQR